MRNQGQTGPKVTRTTDIRNSLRVPSSTIIPTGRSISLRQRKPRSLTDTVRWWLTSCNEFALAKQSLLYCGPGRKILPGWNWFAVRKSLPTHAVAYAMDAIAETRALHCYVAGVPERDVLRHRRWLGRIHCSGGERGSEEIFLRHNGLFENSQRRVDPWNVPHRWLPRSIAQVHLLPAILHWMKEAFVTLQRIVSISHSFPGEWLQNQQDFLLNQIIAKLFSVLSAWM